MKFWVGWRGTTNVLACTHFIKKQSDPQRKRNIIYIWNLKKNDKNELIYNTETVQFWWKPASGLTLQSSPCIIIQQEREAFISDLVDKGTNSIVRPPSSHPNQVPKGPPPDTITLGVWTSKYEFCGDENIQTRKGIEGYMSWHPEERIYSCK